MFASVFIAVVSRSWWRKIGFWMSLLLSSAIPIFIVMLGYSGSEIVAVGREN